MAAFHLIIYGRFWVITEARTHSQNENELLFPMCPASGNDHRLVSDAVLLFIGSFRACGHANWFESMAARSTR
jgi:hypothetical protein